MRGEGGVLSLAGDAHEATLQRRMSEASAEKPAARESERTSRRDREYPARAATHQQSDAVGAASARPSRIARGESARKVAGERRKTPRRRAGAGTRGPGAAEATEQAAVAPAPSPPPADSAAAECLPPECSPSERLSFGQWTGAAALPGDELSAHATPRPLAGPVSPAPALVGAAEDVVTPGVTSDCRRDSNSSPGAAQGQAGPDVTPDLAPQRLDMGGSSASDADTPSQIVELRHVMHAGLTPARAIDGTRRHRLPATPSVLKTGKGRVSKPRRGRSTNRRGVTFHPDLVTGRQSPEMASTPTSVDGACKVPRRSVVRGLIGYALSLFGYREREEM